MPYPELKAVLTDVGTEELGHLEMIGAIVYQLTKNLTPEEIKKGGFEDYFVDHTTGIYPTSASGSPYTAASMAVRTSSFVVKSFFLIVIEFSDMIKIPP